MSHSASGFYGADMKTLITTLLAPMLVGLTMAIGFVTPASAQACLDKRQIQEAVSSGQIASLDEVLAGAGVDPNADILSVQVCDQGGRLVYIIGVLTPGGDAQNLVLSAQ
jgi:hypothetical protein